MTKLNIVFSHGKESGPWGSKITKMKNYAIAKLTTTCNNISIIHGWNGDIVLS